MLTARGSMMALMTLSIAGVAFADRMAEIRYHGFDGRDITIRTSEPQVISSDGTSTMEVFIGLNGIDADGTYRNFFKGSITASSADEAIGYTGYALTIAAGATTPEFVSLQTGGAVSVEAGRFAAAPPSALEAEQLGSLAVDFANLSGTPAAQQVAAEVVGLTGAPVSWCAAQVTCDDMGVVYSPAPTAGIPNQLAGQFIAGGVPVQSAQVVLCGFHTTNPWDRQPCSERYRGDSMQTAVAVTDTSGVAAFFLLDGVEAGIGVFCPEGYAIQPATGGATCSVNDCVFPQVVNPPLEDWVPIGETPQP